MGEKGCPREGLAVTVAPLPGEPLGWGGVESQNQ